MAATNDTGPRIIVAGTSGAGKTTLAGELAQLLDLPYVEIDSLFHGPGWTPRVSFVEDVETFIAQDRWITEWQYHQVRGLLAGRATMLIWLDLPRHVVMWRVIRRTVSRRVRRTVIWNGNREGPLRELFTDRDHIIRWAWRTHGRNRAMILRAIDDNRHLNVVRLRSRREVREWISTRSDVSGEHR